MNWPGFIGPAYTIRSLNADAQRCVNMYLEPNEALSQKNNGTGILTFTPGLRLLATIGSGPIREVYRTSGNRLAVVSGSELYEVFSDWSSSLIGTLNTNLGRVRAADNGVQLCLVDGDNGYICTGTGSATILSQITDPDFVGADVVVYVDDYFVFNKPGTSQFYWTAIGDGTDINSLDFQSAMGSPDNITSLLCTHSQLQVFGEYTTETFWDSGSTSVFDRIQGTFVEVGCIAAHTPQKIDNSYIWLGSGENGMGTVWKADSFQPSRISTYAVELALRSYGDLSGSTSWAYMDEGHSFYCLNVPGADATWVYDNRTGTWHERVFTNAQGQKERHRAECHAYFNGTHVVGDYENGNIYAMESATLTDNGSTITRDRVSSHLNAENLRLFLSRFTLDIETGVGLDGTAQGTNPQIMLRVSKDNGHSWGPEHWVSAGKIGEYRSRAIWRRLGSGRDFLVWIRITDPVRVNLLGASIDAEKGIG